MKMPREGSVLGEVSAGVVTACLTVPLCVPAGILACAPLGPDYVAKGAVAGLVCAIAGGITAAVFRRSSFVATFPTTPISVTLGSFVLALATASHGDLRITAAAMTLCVAFASISDASRYVAQPATSHGRVARRASPSSVRASSSRDSSVMADSASASATVTSAP